jgi:CBS domain containing-hemolysin-like protein
LHDAGLPSPMPFAATVLIIGLMIALGVCSAFFSAMETALFALQPRQVSRLREALPHRLATIDALAANPRLILSMILLADTLMNLPLCLLGLYFLHVFCAWRGSGFPATGAGVPRIAFWPAALLLFALVVGVCDLLPKLLALQRAERMARPAINALHYMRPLLGPVCRSLQRVSECLAGWLTPRQVSSPQQLTEAEFEALVEVGAEEGALQGAESEMIQEIIKLGDKTAKDCMTPRVEAFTIPDSLTNADAANLLRIERRHRVPVYDETPDNIVGILDARRFLLPGAAAESGAASTPHYTEIMDPPSYVSETMRALDLLRSFLSHAQGMAVIVDEYGGTEGIVTVADIIEEIVADAMPSGEDDLYIEELDDGCLLVGGHARLDDISEHLGFALEAEGLDTINGLIFNRLGYLPHAGSVLRMPPLKLTVRRVTRKTVAEVLVEKEPSQPGDTEPESGAAARASL